MSTSISALSSNSTLWELYLQKLKEQQEESTDSQQESFSVPKEIAPSELYSQLKDLQNDPDALKKKAAELAQQVSQTAKSSSGKDVNMLKELSEDLAKIAQTGDLSAMEEKLARGQKGGGPAEMGGMPLMTSSGLSGASSASMKWLEALFSSDSDEESSAQSSNTEKVSDLLSMPLSTLLAKARLQLQNA